MNDLGKDVSAILGDWEWVGDRLAFDAYHAFDVKPGDGMYLAPEDRVRIW